MILLDHLDHIVNVWALPQLTAQRQDFRLLQALNRRRVRHVLIHRDPPGHYCMLGPEHLAEERLSGLGIARLAQQEIESFAQVTFKFF
jgi:hypothetical protein